MNYKIASAASLPRNDIATQSEKWGGGDWIKNVENFWKFIKIESWRPFR